MESYSFICSSSNFISSEIILSNISSLFWSFILKTFANFLKFCSDFVEQIKSIIEEANLYCFNDQVLLTNKLIKL